MPKVTHGTLFGNVGQVFNHSPLGRRRCRLHARSGISGRPSDAIRLLSTRKPASAAVQGKPKGRAKDAVAKNSATKAAAATSAPVKKAATKLVAKIDPTKPAAPRAQSG